MIELSSQSQEGKYLLVSLAVVLAYALYLTIITEKEEGDHGE